MGGGGAGFNFLLSQPHIHGLSFHYLLFVVSLLKKSLCFETLGQITCFFKTLVLQNME